MTSEQILIVDDAPANIRLLAGVLEPRGYEILTASNADQAIRIAARAQPDLILLDVVMPGTDGFAVCRQLKDAEATCAIPVLFVTAKDDTASLLRGFRCGAVDYISKPFQADEVLVRVETHLKVARLTAELIGRNAALEAEIGRREEAEGAQRAATERLNTLSEQDMQRWGIAGFVGRSRLLRRILADIERLHQFAGTNVLITGESGTGKELVARAIHCSSPRAPAPFIPVNCVAIPAELAESLLFGHTRGAFTGAFTDRKGWFELADGGTLFLDEIGDMPPALQAKMLRVLEDGQIVPVGASHPKRVDVRVVAATNADLQERIASGAFREDLYFRLARYLVEMPPLRDRIEDIGLLAEHFLTLFATEMGVPKPPLTPRALALLESHTFPGNVRELKNTIERALIECAGRPIEPAHLRLTKRLPGQTPAARVAPSAGLPLNLEEAEQALIKRALQETAGNVVEAARLLGVNRSRIYRRFRHTES
ncbi:MAG: sigma-54 dependent transcriptional regulator [Acidobacteriota bacterium]